ncbi:hypothetical protein F0562_027603 [Nyssa sinensis]|uniref:RING-type domain-containing protein n=1 Tax=Nyssa sinensis TaxID=561372 RepID=A0A5J5B7S4_9ASTE|nr:hypothetical protein F0562_027603 [Nyssa sinensis]
MYRPVLTPLRHHHPQRWQESGARLLTPLTIWICVSVTLRFGYYGNRHMVLGPSSSRLFEASSVFVKQIEARDDAKKGVYLYGFSEKPELSLETNWSVSNYVIVGSYSRKGFSLWLNKGSRIRMRWEAHTSSLSQLQVSLIKGERDFETLLPTSTSSSDVQALNEPTKGREAEYTIEEDDKYYVGIVNANPRSIIMCRLSLLFPNTQFIIVNTPNNGDLGGWYIELSFVARVLTYVTILGFVVIFILLLMKYLGACDTESTYVGEPSVREITETDPLMREKPFRLPYGTGEEDQESGSSSSSEDLYDGKICVICYDEPRNCFFVPCGHCATCYDCAQRIMDGENKMCPICRRLIHKVLNLPPSPFPTLPILGHLYLLRKPLYRTLAQISARYGPVLYLRFGSRRVLLVSSPTAAEECLAKNDVVFANRPRLIAGKHLGYNYTTLPWSSYGQHWRNLRRISSLEILSSHRLQMLSSIRADEVRSVIRRLFRASEYQTVDMKILFFELMLNVMMRMIAGKRYYGENVEEVEETRRFRGIVEESLRLGDTTNIGDFLPFLRWVGLGLEKKLMALQENRDGFMQELIEQHRSVPNGAGSNDEFAEGKKKTLIQVLLSLQETEPNYYTDEIIRGLMLNEIDKKVGQNRLVNEMDIADLPYLRCIINETLRLYPQGPLLPHESSEDCMVGGFHVPRGTMLLVNVWAIQNDPNIWEDPREFKPERFEGLEGGRDGFKLMPFGSGRRGCPGEGLAMRMVGLALGSLIQCFDWKRAGKEMVDMREGTGLTLPKAQPLMVRSRPRPSMVNLLSQIM